MGGFRSGIISQVNLHNACIENVDYCCSHRAHIVHTETVIYELAQCECMSSAINPNMDMCSMFFFFFFVLSSVFIDGVRKNAVRSLSAGPTKRSCEGTQRSSRNCTLIMRCVTSNTSYTTMRLPRNIFLFINALAIKCPAACTATANLKLVHMKKSDFNPFEMFIYAKFMAAINFNDMPFTPGRFTTCFDRVLYNKIFFFFFVFLSMLYPILRFVCAHGEFLYAIDVRQIPV